MTAIVTRFRKKGDLWYYGASVIVFTATSISGNASHFSLVQQSPKTKLVLTVSRGRSNFDAMGQCWRALLLLVVVLLACARGEQQALHSLSSDDDTPQTFTEYRHKKSIRQRDPIDRPEHPVGFVGEAIGRRGARLTKGMSSSISFANLCVSLPVSLMIDAVSFISRTPLPDTCLGPTI